MREGIDVSPLASRPLVAADLSATSVVYEGCKVLGRDACLATSIEATRCCASGVSDDASRSLTLAVSCGRHTIRSQTYMSLSDPQWWMSLVGGVCLSTSLCVSRTRVVYRWTEQTEHLTLSHLELLPL